VVTVERDSAIVRRAKRKDAAKYGCPSTRLPAASAVGGHGKRKNPQARHTGWLRLADGVPVIIITRLIMIWERKCANLRQRFEMHLAS